jgi:hypothetical protein
MVELVAIVTLSGVDISTDSKSKMMLLGSSQDKGEWEELDTDDIWTTGLRSMRDPLHIRRDQVGAL